VAENPPGVLIACHANFEDQIGGSFKLATEFAETLAKRGYKVYYVSGTSEENPQNPIVRRGVEVYRYPYPKAQSPNPLNFLAHVRGTHRLAKQILRKSRIAVLNGHTPLQFLGASLALGHHECSQVYSVHSPLVAELTANWRTARLGVKQRAALAVARSIERWNCRRASVVQTFSQFTLRHMTSEFPREIEHKGTVCPAWIDVDRFRPASDRGKLRSALGSPWEENIPTFFSLRRLEPRMGLEQLIAASRLLADDGFEFRVVLGGSGSLKPLLEQQIAVHNLGGRVSLIGRVPEEDLQSCFAAADCFVLPTRELECFGIIILEAYASGTPVIGTPVAAIGELIGGLDDRWITDGIEPPDLAARMAGFLNGELSCDASTLTSYAGTWDREPITRKLEQICVSGAAVESSH
jgi:glycosyltransferase involved in cell wall biosynthesis